MTGVGPIDADHAFAKAARARRRAAAVRWLRGEPAECGRLAVFEATEIPRAIAEIRRGIREIPLEAIRGTLEPPGQGCSTAVSDPLPAPAIAGAMCGSPNTAAHRCPDRRRPGRRRLRPTRRTPPGLSGHRPRRARDRRHRRGCRRTLRGPVTLRSPVHPEGAPRRCDGGAPLRPLPPDTDGAGNRSAARARSSASPLTPTPLHGASLPRRAPAPPRSGCHDCATARPSRSVAA